MSEALLAGIRVVDLAGEPAAMTGRILADLGAEVVLVEPVGGHPLRRDPHRWRAWSTRKTVVDPEALDGHLAAAHVVIDTPGFPGAWALDPARAPRAVWVSVTPFGRTGPRSHWCASDLGVMASSGNLYCTGDPDRAPVRCAEPVAYAHTGPEAAFAALTALASGRPQQVDVSMQEVVLVANMTGPANFPKTGFRGARRGANIGRTREIWPCADGWVSFGLRGGKARVPSLELITKLVLEGGIDAPALITRDWSEYSPAACTDDELRAIEAPIAEYFSTRTMQELYDTAAATNLMLAPANSPKEILASAQLAAREFFEAREDIPQFPRAFVRVRYSDVHAAPQPVAMHTRAWQGTNILEFGSGAAGPIATRYFAEHGATVLRVESATRPDFLRVYALGPNNLHGLEGSTMYDGLNVGKRNVTFNLKHPDAVALVKRLVVKWADAVVENFAPRAMRGFGLDYDSLAALKPDLVMASACLNGQTGPHKDYPGFGGQGAALSGYNWLTGWPDRAPVGPHGTITDSLAPRFVATALAAGLLHRRRTGQGVYLDVSQVECAIYTLTPWLLRYQLDGKIGMRMGNAHKRALVHDVFRGAGDDRWVAIAAWTSDERDRLLAITGEDIGAWTATRDHHVVAEQLQAAGIEAVPVEDFADLHNDPQLAVREHFVALTHPVMGDGLYERNGFRLQDAASCYDRSGPTLGQDNDWVLRELLGLSPTERTRLRDCGALD